MAAGAVIGIICIGFLYLLWRKIRKFFRYGKKEFDAKKTGIYAAIPVLIIGGLVIWNTATTVVVIIHLLIFMAICDGVGVLVGKATKKKPKFYVQGVIAIVGTAIYLGIAYYLAVNVWETDYVYESDKIQEDLRIAQISDSHIGATFDGKGFAKHMEVVQETNPDIVLLTGDFVDDGTKKVDMIRACQALGEMKTKYGVYFIFGNHDKGYFRYRDFTEVELREELERNSVKILEDQYELLNDSFYVIGRQDRTEKGRKTAEDLVKEVDHDKYMILLDHQPNDYDAEARAGVDLVLSGHTHGGQLIPIGPIGEVIGANDNTYGEEVRESTTFIVNSGISDWEIPFKTGTKSEFVILDIKKKQ